MINAPQKYSITKRCHRPKVVLFNVLQLTVHQTRENPKKSKQKLSPFSNYGCQRRPSVMEVVCQNFPPTPSSFIFLLAKLWACSFPDLGTKESQISWEIFFNCWIFVINAPIRFIHMIRLTFFNYCQWITFYDYPPPPLLQPYSSCQETGQCFCCKSRGHIVCKDKRFKKNYSSRIPSYHTQRCLRCCLIKRPNRSLVW